MVSVVWALVFASTGLLCYLLPAIVAPSLSTGRQQSIGEFYYKQAMRSYRQVAFVRRLLGSYDLLPIKTNDEQRSAVVVLDSGVLGDDKKLPYNDPTDAIKRMYGKPLSINVEDVPSATSPGLGEQGHWVEQRKLEQGLFRDGEADPYVPVSSGLRFTDPLDTMAMVPKGTRPESITTAEQLTKKRFEKYGNEIGLAETLSTLTGAAVGFGLVAAGQYLNSRVLDDSGGGGNPDPEPIPAAIQQSAEAIPGVVDVGQLPTMMTQIPIPL